MQAPWLQLDELIAAAPVKGAYLPPKPCDAAGRPLFRMALWRVWDKGLPLLAVMALNPSRADAQTDDMTSIKIAGFATRRGYGGYILGNLYGYRATAPIDLIAFGARNAVGSGSREWIEAIVGDRDCLVAWGVFNSDDDHLRATENLVVSRAARTFCLGVTVAGYPRHPSRIGYDTPWVEWTPDMRKGS